MSPHSGGPRTPTPEEQRQFFDDVRRSFSHLPGFIASKFNGRIASAYRLKGFAGAQAKYSDVIHHDLHLVDLTHQLHTINPDELPGYIFGGLASDAAHGAIRAMTFRFNALVDEAEEDARMLAQDIAAFLCAETEHLSNTLEDEDPAILASVFYSMAAGVTEHFKAEPPEWARFAGKKLTLDQIKVAISRMLSERFWTRHLRTFVSRWREHLHIAVGDVRRQRSVICSPQWVQRWMASRSRGREIMAETDLEDEETGETLSLLAAVDASVSSNEKRRAEMMTRISGLEELADLDSMAQDKDYTGLFFTWTAPSQYHSWLVTGRRNRKWNGAGPRETQQYFTRTFKNLSAALARSDVQVFGVRIVESGHDATPHWHGILFVRREKESALRAIFESYANAENCHLIQQRKGSIATAARTQLALETIDKKKGSATAYITKHINRSLEGCAPGGNDPDTGRPWSELARHSAAWSSLWGIKQFQFIGGPPVSVWRELRSLNDQRKADSVSHIFGELHRAADGGDWAAYTRGQGGLFTSRKNLTMRTWYKPGEEPDECGRYTATIRGVYLQSGSKRHITTRIRKWTIKKNAKPGSMRTRRKSALAPWTCVNNCIMRKKQPVDHPPDRWQKIPVQLELNFGEVRNQAN